MVHSNSERVVGRGGLEPPASAVGGPERCAARFNEMGTEQRCTSALSGVTTKSHATTVVTYRDVAAGPGDPGSLHSALANWVIATLTRAIASVSAALRLAY